LVRRQRVHDEIGWLLRLLRCNEEQRAYQEAKHKRKPARAANGSFETLEARQQQAVVGHGVRRSGA